MKVLYIQILLLLSIITSLAAAPIDKFTAEKLAVSYLDIRYIQYGGKVSKPDISGIEEFLTEGADILAYIVKLAPEGFILVSGDDAMTPVISYSWEASAATDPVFQVMLKKDINNRWRYLPQQNEEVTKSNKDKWDYYLDFKGAPSYTHKIQSQQQWPSGDNSGWLDTAWDQSPPYNNLCPVDPNTAARSVVGCTATAFAQIVNFHQFPTTITFNSDDAYVTDTRSIDIDGDAASAGFPDFDQMNNLLSNIDYSDPAQGYAPALCFACGILSEMDYTSSESGAYPVKAAESFKDKLNYRDAEYVKINDPRFYDILKENIKSAFPALLAIEKDGNADRHAIVADGYRATGEYHLNFGWGSGLPTAINSAWYVLPEGMPSDYSIIYEGVLNIIPNDNTDIYGHPISVPNPFYPQTMSSIKIYMQADNTSTIDKVKIYDLTGNFVAKLTGGVYAVWDGKNKDGDACASGLYFYSLRTEDEKTYRGKITLIR